MLKYFTNGFAKILNNSVVKNAFILYIGRAVNLIIGLLSTLIYGVIFLKKDIALISLFEMVVGLFLSFGFTWSTMAVTRFGKEELKNNNSLGYTSSIRIGIIAPLLLISIILLVLFKESLLEYIGSKDTTLISLLICNLVLLVIHEHIIYIFITVEKHFFNALHYIGESIGKIGILAIFYFRLVENPSAELYLKLSVIILMVLLVIRLFFIKYHYFFPIVVGKKHDYVRHLKYVLPQIYGFCGLYIINWVDVYFIRMYCTMDDLGAYQFMYSIFVKLSGFAIIINTIFFPKIMDWKITGSENFKKYLRYAPTGVLLGAVVCFGIFLHIYPPVFSLFFNDKFGSAYSSFNILVLSLPFVFGSYLFVPVLNSYDRVGYIQLVNVISAGCNILIDYYFIRKYGIIAAAYATLIAYLCKYILLSMATERMFNVKFTLINVFIVMISICAIIYLKNIY